MTQETISLAFLSLLRIPNTATMSTMYVFRDTLWFPCSIRILGLISFLKDIMLYVFSSTEILEWNCNFRMYFSGTDMKLQFTYWTFGLWYGELRYPNCNLKFTFIIVHKLKSTC
jgi:hypothetical protein